MIERLSAWFPLLLLAVLAAMTYWLDRVVQPPPPPRDGSARHDPDYIIENFRASRMGADGQPRDQLVALRMTHYPDDDTTHLERPVYRQLEARRAPLHVTSERATVSPKGEDVHFHDNVVVVRGAHGRNKELTLRTSYLLVIPGDQLARTDRAVTITDLNTKITAHGLELDNNAKTLKLKANVRMELKRTPRTP
jgi:lipopolysaccharide export system protein LptC